MKKELFFIDNESEFTSTEDEVWDYMKLHKLTRLDVYRAVREKVSGFFFCIEFSEVGETGNCGRLCNKYSPRNGKSGICKNYGNVYSKGEKVPFLRNHYTNSSGSI